MGVNELKPCPFYGGKAVIKTAVTSSVYFVRCKNCARIISYVSDTENHHKEE